MSAHSLVRVVVVAAMVVGMVSMAEGQKLSSLGKKYALLVGVGTYKSAKFNSLKYSENDVDAIEKEFLKPAAGFASVRTLTTARGKKESKDAPTAANIRSALKEITADKTKHDTLLVALSGHGLSWPVEDEKTSKEQYENFFCPSDAQPRTRKLAELKKTMIPITEIVESLDKSGAGVRLLLVDASRNESSDKGRNIDADNLPRPSRGTAMLFACKSGERSFESEKLKHGVFFHHVVEGLKGQAKNQKGEVTWGRLAEYVTDKVSEDVPKVIGDGAKQTPHEIKHLEGSSPVLIALKEKIELAEAQKWFDEGEKYRVGKGVVKDLQKAIALFNKAANKGHADAANAIGSMLARGEGVARDDVKAMKYFRAAADGGSALGMRNVGLLYQTGRGVDRDAPEAVRWFSKAAEKGDAYSMNELGLVYEEGRGVEKDLKKAAEWYGKASEAGLPDAMVNLGLLYRVGRGVAKDEKKAIEWYQKAIDKGSTRGMTNLGAMYESGQGVAKDEKKAIEFFAKAAELGDAVGMAWMGLMYEEGRGVKVDSAVALAWFAKAAARENAFAMFNLGQMYEDGRGTTKDSRKALEWYRKSADRGDARAMYRVGRAYESGNGVDRDQKTALSWYEKAAKLGNGDAKKRLDLLKKDS